MYEMSWKARLKKLAIIITNPTMQRTNVNLTPETKYLFFQINYTNQRNYEIDTNE
jgi:hypothetical protein